MAFRKKKVKEHFQSDDVPQHLKAFIDDIVLKERPDEDEALKKKSANKRKKVEKDAGLSMKKLTSGVRMKNCKENKVTDNLFSFFRITSLLILR